MLIPVFKLDTPADLGLKVIAFSLHGLDNRTPTALHQQRLDCLRAEFNAEHSLSGQQGFHALRELIGRTPSAYPPLPQALFERYLGNGCLPAVSPLVDLYQQWSLNSGLSIWAHDLQRLRLPVTLALSRGGESFQVRQGLPPVRLPAGEYTYFDGDGQVLCRMEYLQSAATAVSAATRSALLVIQGHAQTDPDELYAVAEGLKADLKACCCGESQARRQSRRRVAA
ncbi:phenylalanine--tRNA ligase beta subunit-related protein [Pseudomonas sp. GCM10022188]|uniref:phenylalanine--tRNA ligase beta subunit-related protein n=1 Tax=Pseudomonas TaxID=286 RepID=UPI001E4D956E|nr:phenylalanine--tRNA ligase beta subunit-related protein [Pseudomonas oryzagri]MCC6075270.1 hypothetical protein [Pseudomonas oryzagri]